MTDLLVIGVTAVIAWALYLVALTRWRVAQLAVEERRASRLEARDERERGVGARMDAVEKQVLDLKNQQVNFMANARR